MAGQIFDVKESGIKPCYNIATMGKFRPLHNPLLNGLLSRNTRSPKTYGKDSIICTESQKLNLQRKGMAEGGGVCARLIKVRLGLENLFQAQLQVATHLSPPTLSPLYSHCTRLAAPRLARVTTTQVQQHWIVALCSKAWPLRACWFQQARLRGRRHQLHSSWGKDFWLEWAAWGTLVGRQVQTFWGFPFKWANILSHY